MNLRTASTEFSLPAVPSVETDIPFERQRSAPRRSLRLGRPIPYGWTFGPILLIAAWAAGSALGWIDPRSLPAPWTVVTAAIDLIRDGRLQDNLIISIERVSEGFAFGVAAGIIVALISGLSRIGEYLIDGVVQIKRAVPTLALIPLLMLYLGIGEGMKVTIIAISVYIPVYINLHAYLRAIDNRYVELAETLRLDYPSFIRHVVLPGALPGLFMGLRLGVTAALLALVVVEQINATSGIGYMIYLAGTYGQINIVLVGLVTYAILGLAADATVRFAQRKALSWQRTFES
jgi:sulfonate transport system permease protein